VFFHRETVAFFSPGVFFHREIVAFFSPEAATAGYGEVLGKRDGKGTHRASRHAGQAGRPRPSFMAKLILFPFLAREGGQTSANAASIMTPENVREHAHKGNGKVGHSRVDNARKAILSCVREAGKRWETEHEQDEGSGDGHGRPFQPNCKLRATYALVAARGWRRRATSPVTARPASHPRGRGPSSSPWGARAAAGMEDPRNPGWRHAHEAASSPRRLGARSDSTASTLRTCNSRSTVSRGHSSQRHRQRPRSVGGTPCFCKC